MNQGLKFRNSLLIVTILDCLALKFYPVAVQFAVTEHKQTF